MPPKIAFDLTRQRIADPKVRVINIVDLMTLQPREEHPHGQSVRGYKEEGTTSTPFKFCCCRSSNRGSL